MNGRYVHVSSSWREEKERHIYSLKSVCFYEKQTPLQYLHVLWFFFPFIFLSCSKEGWFVLKGFQEISYTCSCSGGNKIKSLLVKSSKWKSNFGRLLAIWKTETQHEGHIHPAVCNVSQTRWGLSIYTFHPSTLQTDCKQDICLHWAETFFREGCFQWGERLHTLK